MIATRTKTYFSDVVVYDAVDIQNRFAGDAGLAAVVRLNAPQLVSTDGQTERLLFPVFNSRDLLSVVSMQIGEPSDVVGVTEIWEPVAPYQEVKLAAGSFGPLERFQNVSSFVRFEKGNGLPGQVWETGQSVIHDDLANHPGFLRAAGASAGSLQTAIGIPVFSDHFIATVVLIGSVKAPVATACEVWGRSGDQFELQSAVYQPFADESQFDIGHTLSPETGLLELVCQHRGAVTSSDSDTLMADRDGWKAFSSGLAIPSYIDGKIASVTKLLF
ncbi:GAF domain-containing protein [Planctomycetes bacterium K23_9]|uniref:GAF domain-containing protein n=1 Tax=Stieleria marina TaxID=1930275 RepID=A0A517P1U0_9BACT|nr:hypothetical protein K239x_53650 [Planctomycetes bacterium K23_9]